MDIARIKRLNTQRNNKVNRRFHPAPVGVKAKFVAAAAVRLAGFSLRASRPRQPL